MIVKGLHITTAAQWLLALVLSVACTAVAYGQDVERKIDVNIYNRYDTHEVDTSYMGNVEVFSMLDSVMQDSAIIAKTGMIQVNSSSSIEGSVAYNTRLSERRMYMIERIFRSRYDYIPSHLWQFSFTPENWVNFEQMVQADKHLPNKAGVVAIIERTDVDADQKERLLNRLDDGEPWRYIQQHILPTGRGSVSMLFLPNYLLPIVPATPFIERTSTVEEVTPPAIQSPPATYSRPILAIRSNLLLDATSTVNIGVEVPIVPSLSVSAQYITPWWDNWDRDLTWQIESLYFELRYWFGNKQWENALTGFNIGAYAGSGRYDLQPFSEKGVQGEFSDFGLSLSYAHRLGRSKNWLLEYTIGGGYINSNYRKYHAVDATEEYGNIKVMDYPWGSHSIKTIMPTRLGITLAYVIHINGLTKKGGNQ